MTVLEVQRVDAHVHLWSKDRLEELRWLEPCSVLNKPQTLVEYARDSPARVAVFVECDVIERPAEGFHYALWEVEEVLRCVRDDRACQVRIGAIIAWAPMVATQKVLLQYLDRLETLSGNYGQDLVRGFRFLLQQKPRAIATSVHLQRNLILLQARWRSCVFELGIDVHRDGYGVLDDAAALVRCAPGVTFVVDHMAKADMGLAEVPLAYRDGMRKLAALPNVCVKISGCLTELPDTVDAHSSFETVLDASPIRAYFALLLDLFGPQRLIWASDWPVLTLSPLQSDNLVHRWYAYCNAYFTDKAIFGANAARIYGL